MVDRDFLKQIPIFSSLNEEDMDYLKTLWHPVSKEAGQLIFRKGDPGESMFIIQEGEVAISVWTAENQEAVLSVLKEGSFFGELALIDGSARTANAKALSRAKLLTMTREEFLCFLETRPKVAITMLRVVAERLRKTNEMIEQTTTRNVNDEIQHHMHLRDRLAARLTHWIGSWGFITTFVGIVMVWATVNVVGYFDPPFDPFPYFFLCFILACLTAIQAPIILMTQNRQAENDRLRAELDFETNRKAELQIQSLHTKLDELRVSELHELAQLQKEQLALLRRRIDG